MELLSHTRVRRTLFFFLLHNILLFLASFRLHAVVVDGYTLKPLSPGKLMHGLVPRVFSLNDLKAYDGTDEKEPVYLAVRGVVFDVTRAKNFYGKNAPYNALAGKDASRAVAKMSLEETDLTDDLTGLTEDEMQALDSRFDETYSRQYPVVGFTVKLIGENIDMFTVVRPKEEL